MESLILKTCSICQISKNLSEFHIKRRNKDGLCPDCKICSKLRMKKYYEINAIKINNLTKIKQLADMELIRLRNRNYKKLNKDKVKSMNKTWKTKNNKLCRAYNAKRRVKKLNATIGNFDLEIKMIYLNCPNDFHVDHVIPLQGRQVSGLHVPWNLQYLSAEDNLKKSNKV